VMKARAFSVQETPHGGVRTQWLYQFDGPDKEDSDPLGREFFDGGTRIPGHELEERASLFQGTDSHGNVVERIGRHVFFLVPG